MADETAYVEVRAFKKGETIFREGDPGGCAFEVQSGKVGIVAGYGTKRETLLTELGEGAVFGELGMVRGFPRSATAVALEPRTDVSVITWEAIGRYFRESPTRIIRIMQQMGQRINELSDEHMEACGVIDELLEQRDALMRECRRQEKTITQLEEKLRCAGSGASKNVPAVEKEEPVWRRIEGESKDMESERFKKYQEAYRRYRKSNNSV